MLGSNTPHSIASKAAETLLECARDLVRRRAARLGSQGTALVFLGDELVQMRTIMRRRQRTLPREHGLEMVQCAKRAVVLHPHTECEWHPKWHLLLHIACGVCDKGNPQFETTFSDEHWNGKMAKAAAKCYRKTWLGFDRTKKYTHQDTITNGIYHNHNQPLRNRHHCGQV